MAYQNGCVPAAKMRRVRNRIYTRPPRQKILLRRVPQQIPAPGASKQAAAIQKDAAVSR